MLQCDLQRQMMMVVTSSSCFWNDSQCLFFPSTRREPECHFLKVSKVYFSVTDNSPHISFGDVPHPAGVSNESRRKKPQKLSSAGEIAFSREGETVFYPLCVVYRGTWTWCWSCDPHEHCFMYIRSAGKVTWPVFNHTHTHTRTANCNVLSMIVLF